MPSVSQSYSEPCETSKMELFASTRLFYKALTTLTSNTRLKLAKNQANVKQQPEAELLPFEDYLLSSRAYSRPLLGQTIILPLSSLQTVKNGICFGDASKLNAFFLRYAPEKRTHAPNTENKPCFHPRYYPRIVGDMYIYIYIY